MKKTLLTLLAFMVAVAVNAGQVSKQQALLKAQQFMPGKQFGEARSYARGTNISEEEPFYVFNADNNGGFVIVSADDRTTEILGYSSAGHFDMEQMPDNLKWWLDGYVRQIEALGSSAKPVQKARVRGAGSWEAIAPMIETKWNQHEPYNLRCPDKSGKVRGEAGFDDGNICVTGCVAAAMAQIMYYYKSPQNCPSIDQYTTRTKGWTMSALPATSFKWTQMKKTYKGDETGESAEAVAELFRYCGQAVEMDYNLGGSSAGITPYEMAKYFGYSKNAKLVSRSMYSSSDWENMIYQDISESRPVLYGGASLSGGHQFIVDGYDGNGLFHMNWGWGGMSDGYYVLSLANPDELGAGGGTSKDGYSMDQNAIIGLKLAPADEVEIPLFYGDIDDLTTLAFSRTSASEDFTGVALPGFVFFQYENSDQTGSCTFETAWGLYQNGSLLQVLGASDPVTLVYTNSNAVYNNPTVSFGKDLADGQYQLRQIYRLQGSTEWLLCKTPYDYYYGYTPILFIEAAVSGNNLTLRMSEPDEYTQNITVNSVTFSPSELEVGKPVEVTVNLTNNGDSFQELVYFWDGNDIATVVCGSVESHEEGEVKLHFTPNNSGKITFSISTDAPQKLSDASVVWSEPITVSAAKPQKLSGTFEIDNFDDKKMILSGTTLKTTAQITNEGEHVYENAIELRLSKNTEDPSSGMFGGPVLKTKSVMTTIQPGETKDVEFIMDLEDMNLEDEYFFFVYYSSAGILTRFIICYPFTLTAEAPTPVPGDVTGEGNVDEDDLNAIVELIMAGEYDEKADLNNDEKVDAADLVLLIKIVNEQQEE